MKEGVFPAIVSFFFPGIGQAITEGRSPIKWILIDLIFWFIWYGVVYYFKSNTAGLIFSVIVSVILAYDAYAYKIPF